MMKKICFVIPSFKPGGGNRVFIELANSIKKKSDYLLQIAYPNNSDEGNHYAMDPTIQVVAIGKKASNAICKLWNVFLLFRLMVKELKENDETYLVFSDPILCNFLWVFRKKYYSRIIRFIQADDYNIFNDLFVLRYRLFLLIFKVLTKLSYKSKIKYVFNSTFSFDRFVAISKRTDVSKEIVHPAVDKNIFYPMNTASSYNKINISLVGRDHPLKRLEDFIGVWSELDDKVKEYVNEVYIISTDKLKRFDLTGLSLVRPTSDFEIADIFRKTDIFVSTSLWEGFSMPPLEAIHCGAVVLSSDSGGINEYAVNEYNALLYEPGNRLELRAKLVKLIEDTAYRNQLKIKSKLISADFSWDKSAKKLVSVIES